jgi:hypothetical protein
MSKIDFLISDLKKSFFIIENFIIFIVYIFIMVYALIKCIDILLGRETNVWKVKYIKNKIVLFMLFLSYIMCFINFHYN